MSMQEMLIWGFLYQIILVMMRYTHNLYIMYSNWWSSKCVAWLSVLCMYVCGEVAYLERCLSMQKMASRSPSFYSDCHRPIWLCRRNGKWWARPACVCPWQSTAPPDTPPGTWRWCTVSLRNAANNTARFTWIVYGCHNPKGLYVTNLWRSGGRWRRTTCRDREGRPADYLRRLESEEDFCTQSSCSSPRCTHSSGPCASSEEKIIAATYR